MVAQDGRSEVDGDIKGTARTQGNLAAPKSFLRHATRAARDTLPGPYSNAHGAIRTSTATTHSAKVSVFPSVIFASLKGV
jgi:hypothetical protein